MNWLSLQDFREIASKPLRHDVESGSEPDTESIVKSGSKAETVSLPKQNKTKYFSLFARIPQRRTG
jgi:hypothetical protein